MTVYVAEEFSESESDVLRRYFTKEESGYRIRKSIRELVDELDPEVFAQVHRSVVVNLRHVAQVVRGDGDNAVLHLRQRGETLPVSRSYLHLFRQM